MTKPQLPTQVYLAEDEVIDWKQFLIIQARHANVTHASSKIKFTPEIIEKLAIICQSEDDLPDDSPAVLWLVLEDICKLLEKSKEYQSNTNMITETVEEAEPLSPQAQEYVATLEAQEKKQLAKREPQEANSQELAIVQAAHAVGVTVSLEEARADLATKFDLGAGSNMLRPLGTVPITPMDIARGMVYGAKLEQSGSWIYADAVNMLMQLNFEDVTNQIAAMLGKANSTLYNYARTARKIPQELRDESIPLTVYSELVNRRYEEDEEKNNAVIAELAEQAVAEKWSCGDARSHADLKQGKQPKPKKQQARYLVIFPGNVPIFTNSEPVWSQGIQAYDTKQHMRLFDDGKMISWVAVAVEPSDEQIRELQSSIKQQEAAQ